MALDYADQISTGYDVYGSDDEKIGSVAEVGPNYFLVEKGFLFVTDIYVPLSAVTSVQDNGVRLNLTKDQVENQGWDAPPEEDGHKATDMRTESEGQPIERVEERLKVDKQTVQSGEVRIGKDVTEEEQSVDVPVKHEKVRVSTRTVDRPAGGEAFEDQDISVALNEEQVEVSKEARVVEELDVEKEVVEDTERVSGTVRREEFRVDGDVDRSEERDR